MTRTNQKSVVEIVERLVVLAIVVGCVTIAAFYPPMLAVAVPVAVEYVRAVIRNARRR